VHDGGYPRVNLWPTGPRFTDMPTALKVRRQGQPWLIGGRQLPPRPRADPLDDEPLPPKLPAPPDGARPLCAGRSLEWEDMSPAGTRRARAVCVTCPAVEWCAEQAQHAVRAGLPITGTWAGEVYSSGTRLTGGR
jgi:hypothetical protein